MIPQSSWRTPSTRRRNWHRSHRESRNIRTTCSSYEARLLSESKANLRSLIDFTLLGAFDSTTWDVDYDTAVSKFIMSPDITGGPNDQSMADLQLCSHAFCYKSSRSLPSPLYVWKNEIWFIL